MNAAIYMSVLYGLYKGYAPLLVSNGFEGLCTGDIYEATWTHIDGLLTKGGSAIGTNRMLPGHKVGAIGKTISSLSIDALVVIGGFEAFVGVKQLKECPHLKIPMVYIPATISNNIPCTEYTVGSDTALNTIVRACDTVKQSANSSWKRVFIVEVQGGNCGYLAILSGIAAGASQAYTPEEGLGIRQLQLDAERLKQGFEKGPRQGRVIVKNEHCSRIFDAKLISKILESEGDGIFDSRFVVLGHLQQGGLPSPIDRIEGVLFALKGMEHLEETLSAEQTTDDGFYAAVVLKEASLQVIDLEKMCMQADFSNRKGIDNPWIQLKGLFPILSW